MVIELSRRADSENPFAESVPSAIANWLRLQISRGSCAPGVKLEQADLAERFKANRISVREALMLLTEEGLVAYDTFRGFFVARISRDEAEQIFQIGRLVEGQVFQSLVWPDATELAHHHACTKRMRELARAGDLVSWWVEHRALHRAILRSSPKRLFVRESIRLWTLIDRLWLLQAGPHDDCADHAIFDKRSVVRALRLRSRSALLEAHRKWRDAYEGRALSVLEAHGA